MNKLLLAAAAAMLLGYPALGAPLEVTVFLSAQRMTVTEGGETSYAWDVSTGKKGHRTPTGIFSPQFLSPNHRSSLYENAPMPNSVFFNGNIAAHGTWDVENLGWPVSHGCVRLTVANSAILYRLVEEYGFENTQIRVVE